MNTFEAVVKKSMHLVTPTPRLERKIDALAASILRKTKKAAARQPEARGVILGGSFAKGTWLPGYVDLDFFVKFDPATPEDRFEEAGLAIGESATAGFPRGKKYAQHPYTEAWVQGTRVNIVPCYDVKRGEWISAADRSPYHVRLVRGLESSKKTEIRLLKRFMNSVGVYGAEIRVQGFSGYAAEALVLKFGGLRSVLEHFASMRPTDDERFLTLPDPIDPKRDLATAISNQSVATMVLASREFLRRPSTGFFREMSKGFRPRVSHEIVALLFLHKELSEDTLWGELRKTTKHIVRHLEAKGFRVARSIAASDNKGSSAILLIPEARLLPRLEQKIGPTVDRRRDVEAFVASNRRRSELIWVDDDARVRALRPRNHLELEPLLIRIARGREGDIGASKELWAGMKRSAKVLWGASLERKMKSAKWLDAGVKEISSDAIGTR